LIQEIIKVVDNKAAEIEKEMKVKEPTGKKSSSKTKSKKSKTKK